MRAMEALIIDEISMVRADLLDGVDFSLRRNRDRNEPFGGVKVVFFGDLLQLEPVVRRGAEMEMLVDRYESPFFFDCDALKDAPPDVIELTQVHRQAGDPEMLHALNQLRCAELEALELFNTRVHARIDEAKFITLTPRRDTADAMNSQRLMEIPGQGRVYSGITEGDFYEEYPTDPNLRLKAGARVMMVRSQPPDWVNGSLGTVEELAEKTVRIRLDSGESHQVEAVKWEKVRWTWDSHRGRIGAEVVGTFTQLPVRLAWALTVHKSQGLTFDAVRLDFGSRAFAHGQLYVALSRCRSLAGLSLASPLRQQDLIIDQRVMELHGQLGLS
jgi:ATP-dependent exoDNAse (exonuclease V) alpha subunit